MSNYISMTRHPRTGEIELASWLDDHDGKHRYGVRFPSDGQIYGGHECVEVTLNDLLAEIERLRDALHEWDALIQHQYSGSQEAMSDMTYAAQRTAHLLYGEAPWPEPRRAALAGEKTND